MLEMAEVEAIQATEEAEAVQEADGEEVQFIKHNKIRLRSRLSRFTEVKI